MAILPMDSLDEELTPDGEAEEEPKSKEPSAMSRSADAGSADAPVMLPTQLLKVQLIAKVKPIQLRRHRTMVGHLMKVRQPKLRRKFCGRVIQTWLGIKNINKDDVG